MTKVKLFFWALLLGTAGWVPGEPATFAIQADKPGIAIPPMLYGIFFEDINRSGDGGLYAEMLQNRSFEDFNLPMGWTLLNEGGSESSITLDKGRPLNPMNPTSLRLDITSAGARAAIYNQGYKGVLFNSQYPVTDLPAPNDPHPKAEYHEWMDRFNDAQKRPDNGLWVEAGKGYHGSLEARADGDFTGTVTVSLEKQDGTVLAEQDLPRLGPDWKRYDYALKPTARDTNARFVVATKTTGTLWLDMVSLFPDDTFNHRPNGLRPDLMQMLEALHPAFVRFPAGSFGEGKNLNEAFRWKDTIGDLAERPGGWNIWGYRTTNGLGFYEYLQMCEDLKAEPLFVINCGISETDMVDPKDLGPWIQDAVDCVDYANGPTTGKWGALRAQAGHPAPFNMKNLEIGNENGMGYFWGGGNAQQYADRYNPFYEKVKAAYPDLHTIATAPIQKPPVSSTVEAVDEHYYESSNWFQDHATMYDSYDRKGPKIYVGEYACKSDAGNGNLNAALGEAAFMTGIERNSDVVTMASYAPLFVNPSWRAWNPNLIAFDSSRVYGTPSYYNQMLFATNRPDVILPLEMKLPVAGDAKDRKTLYAVAGKMRATGEIILKVVNTSDQPRDATITINGGEPGSYRIHAIVLSSEKPSDENTFDEPMKISPKENVADLTSTATDIETASFPYTFASYSITVLHLKN
jgi:alpha-L-arabinofuranosidase